MDIEQLNQVMQGKTVASVSERSGGRQFEIVFTDGSHVTFSVLALVSIVPTASPEAQAA